MYLEDVTDETYFNIVSNIFNIYDLQDSIPIVHSASTIENMSELVKSIKEGEEVIIKVEELESDNQQSNTNYIKKLKNNTKGNRSQEKVRDNSYFGYYWKNQLQFCVFSLGSCFTFSLISNVHSDFLTLFLSN